MDKGSRKKSDFLIGRSTKAFTPLPSRLVVLVVRPKIPPQKWWTYSLSLLPPQKRRTVPPPHPQKTWEHISPRAIEIIGGKRYGAIWKLRKKWKKNFFLENHWNDHATRSRLFLWLMFYLYSKSVSCQIRAPYLKNLQKVAPFVHVYIWSHLIFKFWGVGWWWWKMNGTF